MENICNFCACSDETVVELKLNDFTQEYSILDIAATHFWFTTDELEFFCICDTCRDRLLDFHQFYSQVERLCNAGNESEVPWHPALEDDSCIETVPLDIKVEEAQEVEHLDCLDNENTASRNDIPTEATQAETIAKRAKIAKAAKTKELHCTDEETTSTRNATVENENSQKDDESKILPHKTYITDAQIRSYCKIMCHVCSNEFENFAELRRHTTSEHKQRCFVECCGCKFDDVTRLIEHILIHMDPNIFRCKLCWKQMSAKRSLIRHMHTVHGTEEIKTVQCKLCPKKFAKRYLLSYHLKGTHKIHASRYNIEEYVLMDESE